jgi:hypothetical protein
MATSKADHFSLAPSATIKKQPSYFSQFLSARTGTGRDSEAGAEVTWHEVCCGKTEVKSSRSLRLQAMHAVFNALFTVIFVILLAFALVWLELYYVNYFRASSVLLDYSEFQSEFARVANSSTTTAGPASAVGGVTTVAAVFGAAAATTAPSAAQLACAAEDCFLGWSCDELQSKDDLGDDVTCATLEAEYGCTCEGCACRLDVVVVDAPYVPPLAEDRRFTTDGYDYGVVCAAFHASNATCALTCSCTDEEVAEYCGQNFNLNTAARSSCVMLPVRSDGSCTIQQRVRAQAEGGWCSGAES